MSVSPDIVIEVAKAFEIANIEMFAVSLPDVTVIEATSAVLRKWNCRREDLAGRHLAKYGTGALSARYVDEEGPDGPAQRVEVKYAPPLGNARSIVFTPQTWKDGGRQYMILIGQHASKEQADEAMQNERRLSLALRSGGFAAWDYDYRTGETYNSPEMYDLVGYPRDSRDLNFHSFNELIHPDDRGLTLEGQIKQSPFGSDLFQTRYRVKMYSGEYAWIESIAGLIRDPFDGKPAKCVGLSRNINDQMASLEKLKASELNFRRSQKAAQIGSFTLKAATNVSRLSSEMIALIGLEDAVIQPNLAMFEKMMEPADCERFREAIELARLGSKIPGFEIAVKSLKTGELNYFQCNIETERNAAGQIETLFGTCQSTTERKALERRFLQAQKMEAVGQLTGGIAHDFNNLLMVVMGNLQLVEQLVKNDERAVKRIRAAVEACEKGSELTKRMLAYSRQQTLQNKEISVDALVFKMQDLLRQAIGGAVKLKIIPGESVWAVKADATMLETAILNLSINARDAMKPKGGTLIIETSNKTLDQAYCDENEDVTPGDYVEIAVTDTGCGIAPENIEKVFQPFFTTKGPEAGSGLGLSMIYGFTKQSGGHAKIYSEVGHGTTIRLYLPRLETEAKLATAAEMQAQVMKEFTVPQPVEAAPAALAETVPAAAAVRHKAATQKPAAKKTVVLVVEDNPSVREVAAAMIEDMGFETLVAENGVEGLRIIETRPDIDLVLSDVIMAGGMNGPELASKALKVRPELKVLFMSGYAPGSVRQMQDLPDTIDLVNKPFTRNDLVAKVTRVLAA
ncbi:MAG: ATP-binding protein [Hyphomicrobiales bacterium]